MSVPGQPNFDYNPGNMSRTKTIIIDDSATIDILRDRIKRFEEDQKKLVISRRSWAVLAELLGEKIGKNEEEIMKTLRKIIPLCEKQFKREGIKEFSKNYQTFGLKL